MKTTTRKIIAMILGLALTISLFGGATVFAAGTIDVGIAASASSVNVGSNVVITGSISNLVGVTDGIIGYSVKITYDATKFSFVSADKTIAGTDGYFEANGATAGTVYMVYWDNFTGAGNTPHPLTAGSIFTATFTAIAAGASNSFTIAGIDGTDDFVDTASTVAATYGVAASVTTVDAPSYIIGDANESGTVTGTDSLLVLQYTVNLVTLTANGLLAADVNHTGTVTGTDSLMILQSTVGLITLS